MKIGIVTAPLDYGPSGPGVYLENLCRELDEHHDNLDLHLIHYAESDNPIYEHGKDLQLPRTPGRFESAISELDLDVLHYNYIPYKRPLVFALDVSLVVTIHGDLPFVLPEQTPWQRRYIGRPIQKLYSKIGLLDRIDHFVTVSDTVQENVSSGLSIPERKMTTVYSGVDDCFEPVSEAAETVQSRFGIEPPYVLNVNNYMKKKNRMTLINAFDKILDKHPVLTLVLAGGGWEESEVGAAAAEFGLGFGDAIRDLGYISEKHLPALYSDALALVNPTLHETFGLTNVEAMACGCPVITSSRFAVPEIVGDAAILVEDPLNPSSLAQSVIDVVRSEEQRTTFAKRGLERSKRFNWRKTAVGVADVYHHVYYS